MLLTIYKTYRFDKDVETFISIQEVTKLFLIYHAVFITN